MHIFIKHTNHLCDIAVPSDQLSYQSSELIPFFRILQIVSVCYRFQHARHFSHGSCILFSRMIPYIYKSINIILIINRIIQKFFFCLVNQIHIYFLLKACLLIKWLECFQNILFLICEIQHKCIYFSRAGTVQT